MGEGNDYIRVVASEESEELFEFPIEDDDTVFLSTLQAQFPHAIGLKYRSSSGAWRGLSANENIFAAPKGGWLDDVTYVLTISEEKKRKAEMDSTVASKKMKTNTLLQDMVVMNLSFDTSDKELKDYFETACGPLLFGEVKKYHDTGKSRGFGFIRFKNEDDARKAVDGEHNLGGRKIEVKAKEDKPMKLFVGRLPGGTTAENLKEFFSEFGEVTDSWIPTPFRNFGFISFASTQVAKTVMGETQYFNGSRLNIVEREPDKSKTVQNKQPEANKFNDKRTSRSNYGGGQQERAPPPPQPNGGMDADLKKLLIQCLQHS